ncbi:MAG: shikimate dehydrogenase [Bacteroidota bacterium]
MRTFGLIGFPLEHSFSAKYFNEKFAKENVDAVFNLYPIQYMEELPQLIEENKDLKGLSVTISYKEKVIPFLNELSEEAQKIGAVNCIRIDRNENVIFLKGFNTDAHGFRQAIGPFLESHHNAALILGNGGAAKAVHFVLTGMGIACRMVSRFPKDETVFSYTDLNQNILSAFKLIVNTTPLGMFPDIDEAPSLPYEFITENHFCFDVVYNPAQTQFMKNCAARGAMTENGYNMLCLQAEKAWEIWK